MWFNFSGFIHFLMMWGMVNDMLEIASNSVFYGEWSYVVVVLEWSIGMMKIYVNGVLVVF